MVKMYPPYISPDIKSQAEKRIFEKIKSSNNLDGFSCFHSLGIARHLSKRQGEIDFVLVGNDTILCLEVKGGRISRKNGYWSFTDKYGQINTKREGPFEQASSGMYSLKSDIEEKFGNNHGFLLCYGVVFPDIEFKEVSPEWDLRYVYDIRDISSPFFKYVDRAMGYWKSRSPKLNPRSNVKRSDIIHFLRGNFEITTKLWSILQETNENIAHFTDEQFRALDQMSENNKVIFSGAAGTGKTLLAVESAKRLLFQHKKVLFLCFNRLLGSRLKSLMHTLDPSGNKIQTNSIHKYFLEIVNKANLGSEFSRLSKQKTTKEIYDEVLPSLFSKAVGITKEKYDVVIIDEGQDLLNTNYLLALDAAVSGGFENGKWRIFLDPGGQAKLFNRYSSEAYEYLKQLGASIFVLDMNVRNTKQIATQATIVSGFPSGKASLDGPKVDYILCKNEVDMAIKTIELTENLINNESVLPETINLLTCKNTGSMSLFSSGVRVPSYFEEATEGNINKNIKGKILFSSAQAFKGLENDVIIYTDVTSLDGRLPESVNYVAMTRAKVKLYVLMDKNLQKKYQDRLTKFVKI